MDLSKIFLWRRIHRLNWQNRAEIDDVHAVNKDRFKPLHRAARKGAVQIVVELILAGADVNAREKFGHTPLLSAVVHHHITVVTVLVIAKADPAVELFSGRKRFLILL